MIKQVLYTAPILPRARLDFVAGNLTLWRAYGDNRKNRSTEIERVVSKMVVSSQTNAGENIRKKRQRIEQELELFRTWNDNIPETLEKHQWNALLYNCDTESKRFHYYKKLAKSAAVMRIKSDKINTQTATPSVKSCQTDSFIFLDGSESFSADVPSDTGSLWRDRVQEVHKHRGIHSLIHGAPVIFDADYDMDFVTEKQASNHIRFCNKINLHHCDPAHIIVGGCKNREKIKDHLTHFSDDFYLDFHEANVMDLFDKQQLVYLLPYGPPIPFFNPNAMYVIQPISYFTGQSQSALWKAKKHGIKHGSLPFNRFPGMVSEKFIPSVPVMFRILRDLHQSKSFKQAFRGLQQKPIYF